MPSPEETMFNEAVSALKKGDKARARDLLTRLIKRVPTQPDIWLWMSAAVETRRERVYCLKEALRLDPTSRTARHGLILAGELPPDPTLAIPPELQRRNWESQLAALQVQPERELLGLSWKQIGLYAAAAVVVIALVTVGILGLRQRSTQRVFIPSSVPTYGPTPTSLPSLTPVFRSPTVPAAGPTPLWMLLEATYTPTPLYVNTPHGRSEAYSTALRAYANGQWAEMEDYLEQSLRDEPNAVDLLYYMGETYRLRKDTKTALRYYEQAIAQDPNFAPAYLGRAYAYLASQPRRVREAERDLKTAVEADPNYAEAYLQLAVLNLGANDPEQALRNLEAVGQLQPDSPLLYYYRARAHLTLGDVAEARAAAEQANTLDKTMLESYRLLAEVCSADQDPECTLQAVNTYLLYEPRDAQALAWQGGAYAAQDNSEAALQSFSRALEIDRSQAEIYIQRGELYRVLGDYDKAIVDLTQAIGLNQRSYAAQSTLGKVFFAQGDYQQVYNRFAAAELYAATDLQKAEVLFYRAQAQEKLNRVLPAMQDYQKLLAMPAELYPEEWAELARERLTALHTPTRTAAVTTPTHTRQPTLTPRPTQTRQPTLTHTPTP